MAFISDLLARVESTVHLNDAAKQSIQKFLTANAALLENAGPELLQGVLSAVLTGNAGAWEKLLPAMNQADLLNLLQSTERALDPEIDQRTQAVSAFNKFGQSIGEAALSVLSKLAMAAL